MKKKHVVVVGLGYVGFQLAITVSQNKSYFVTGIDLNKKRVDLINNKVVPLSDYASEISPSDINFHAENNYSSIKTADYIIVCVPTPVYDDFKPNLNPLKDVCNSVSQFLQKRQVVIIESTINPGVCEEIILPILETGGLKGGKDFELVHCPERINLNDPKWNIHNIPRNVAALTKGGARKAANFYRSFLKAPINEMKNLKEVEATKMLENAFRDINIAFINELAKSFDKLGIDIANVIKGASNKPFAFLPHYPGCGVGGHCIPVDPYYLIEAAGKVGFDHKFLRIAREVNNSMPAYTVNLLINELNKIKRPLNGTKVGLLGLSYKKDTGDIRESPSLHIEKILKEKGAIIYTYDPFLKEKSSMKTLDALLRKVEVIVISTDHTEFRDLTGTKLKEHSIKILIDGRNCLNKEKIMKAKIIYKGIGR